ncbi:type III polyketide synthase [Azospirillum canadense]|uniref:type III polyketide synthase n=1 Tax=Azospirillum canadense TaxID=403962 RepID=UPI002227D329|nr:type III polyketide synthase [Azospirillum canadense]MCW2236656.1 alkylresorcinol/alkylpyrone synthase [Azospirillum canadense]
MELRPGEWAGAGRGHTSMAMTQSPRILSVATALPPHQLDQNDTLAAARAVFGPRMRDFDRLAPVFANTGIETRHAVMPMEWYIQPRGWPERTAAFREGALVLLEEAAGAALSRAGLRPADVDAIVCASTTGIATPSLEALLLERMGFRPDTVRVPLFGLGCAGGVLGLARAGQIAQAMAGRTVLFLVVELCTLACRTGEATPTNVVASALFADGAAAAVLRADGDETGAPLLRASAEHTWPGTRDVMGWRVEDDGFGVIFSQDIPTVISARLGPVVERFLDGQGMARTDLAGLVCHPGGAKVLHALEAVFDPVTEGLADAWAVLRACGNMSAASVMFVLERRLAAGASGPHLMSALGPGFTAALALVDL